MNIPRGLPLLAAVVILLTAFTRSPAQTIEAPTPDAPWALADVEVTDSPLVTIGQLENGLRYVIRPHSAPDRQLSLRLFVRAGSLDENDDERGFAHFVEHMAFNGTKNFPAGELVRFLQRQGAQFGPHINATTSYLSTIYKLDLPGSSPDSLETGLRIFRDFADGLLFETSEVKRERGVILSEARTRNTPQLGETLAFSRFLYGSTSVPERLPIGVTEQIEKADRSALLEFYDAWYRPENLVVIVVGPASAPEVESLLKKHFASLKPRGPARTRPELGQIPALTAPVAAVHPRPLAGASINLVSITNRPIKRQTWADRLYAERVYASLAMITDRLGKISASSNSVIKTPSFAMEVDFLRFRRISLIANTSPDKLSAALGVLEQELRRTIESGFTAEELVRYQDALRRSIRSSAESAATLSSAAIANAFVSSVEDNSPLRLMADSVDALLDIVDRLRPEDCRHALQDIFQQPPHIFVTCMGAFAPSSGTILEAYQTSRGALITRNEAGAPEAIFAYQDFGPAGAIAEKNHVPDLGLWQLRMANGVRVNLKPTKFEAGSIRFSLRMGYGRLAEPTDKPGLALWLPFLWEGGTGKHTVAELSRMTGGLNRVTTRARDDASVLNGTFPRANFPLALRQLTALLADPAFREEGWESAQRSLRGYTGPLWNQPEGAVAQFVFPLLAGKDSRIGLPNDSKTFTRTAEEFRAWFAPQLATGPMEFSLVGDFDLETVIDEIARTLGTLPERANRDASAFPVELNFRRDRGNGRYYYMGTADRVCRWEFFWRIREPVTPKERRQIDLLASIFEDRVREEVREKKSSTYRVEGGVSWNDTYPGFSFIRCSVDHKPTDQEKHSRAVSKLALAIAKKGITADELTRAKSQALAALTHNRSDNGYWIERVLADSQQRPFRLDAQRSAESDLTTTTVADINKLVARYFGPDRVSQSLIEPSALKPEKNDFVHLAIRFPNRDFTCPLRIPGPMPTPTLWSDWVPLPFLPELSERTLAELLDGGQAFRWKRQPDGSWLGVWSDCIAQIRRDETGVVFWRAPASSTQRVAAALPLYLGKDASFDALIDALPSRSDAHLALCLKAFPGLRILRQPFGETLLGFLCSATKQIVQIKQMMELLAVRHGASLGLLPATEECPARVIHRLPSWTELAAVPENKLRECLLGFRARYIHGTAQFIAANPGWLEETEQLPYPEAKERLCSLPGVGEKVADCVLLFGAGKMEAFPVDVWILKTLEKRYGLDGWKPAQVAQFGRAHFGAAAGLAQQFLFAYERAAKREIRPV